MNRLLLAFSIPVAALVLAASSLADPLPPDVLVKSRWMELTRADFDAVVARVPEKLRFEFTTSPKRVKDVLNNLLVTKTLAAQARAHGTRPALAIPKGMSNFSRTVRSTPAIRSEGQAIFSFTIV